MKTNAPSYRPFAAVLILGLLALCVLCGCVTKPFAKLDSQIPDGNWKKANVEIVGEMVNGKIEASGTKQGGKWVDGKLYVLYNGFWVKKIEVDLEVDPAPAQP